MKQIYYNILYELELLKNKPEINYIRFQVKKYTKINHKKKKKKKLLMTDQ